MTKKIISELEVGVIGSFNCKVFGSEMAKKERFNY